MDFADPNIVSAEFGQALVGIFELNRKMAGIVVYSEVQTEARIAGSPFGHTSKKRQGFLCVFEQAKRFRFNAEMKGGAGPSAQLGDVIDAAPKVFHDRIDLAAVTVEAFE